MNSQANLTRRYAIDWIRVLAILTVFLFHSTRFFDSGDWHVKNATTYLAADIWVAFLGHWMMPLIFVISGISTFYALGGRGAGKFLKDRALRLLVPLVVGMFTHIALQVYFERVTHGQFHGSFFEFLPHYFDGLYAFGGNFAWMGLHLWYLEMLFVFSLVCLPLLLWLRRGSGARPLHGLGEFLARPGTIYLLALPIMLALAAPDPEAPWATRAWGGWSLVACLLFFLYGFVLGAHEGVGQGIQRVRWVSLAAGLVLFGTLAGLVLSGGEPEYGQPRYTLVFSMYGLSAWCWILAILGFGLKHLTGNTPFLSYANQAVLPFYVLHQTVLLSVGYFVVGMPVPDLLKLGLISTSSFAIIVAIYEFLVRRNNILRILFGMKPLRRAVRPAAPSPVPQVAER
jgi:glucan biosynthesis protein C